MPLEPVSTGDPHVAAHNEEREAINEIQVALPKKLDRPTTPAEGAFLTYRQSAWQESISRLFEGTGQPEGAVPAPIGSRYIDTAAAQGAVEWIKVRDDGANTGWSLIFGDTGWRDVSALVAKRNTATVHVAAVRRINNTVDVFFDITNPTNTTSPWDFITLPGFAPDFGRYGAIQGSAGTAADEASAASDGRMSLHGLTAGRRDRWNGTWMTNSPWPTTLPGTPM